MMHGQPSIKTWDESQDIGYQNLVRPVLMYGSETRPWTRSGNYNFVLLKEKSYVKYIVHCRKKEFGEYGTTKTYIGSNVTIGRVPTKNGQ